MSGLFQDTVTLYIKYTAGLGNWQGGAPPVQSIKYSRVVIKNVMWKDNVHTNSSSDGKSFIDKTVSLTIPFDELELDKTFVKPENFMGNAEEWTLKIGDIIVFGECDKEITATYTTDNLRKDYKTMEIKAIADSTEQDILGKWSIEGV